MTPRRALAGRQPRCGGLRWGYGRAGLAVFAAAAGCAAALWAVEPTAATPVAEYWMRLYPLPVYGSIWRMTLSVADFKKSLPKVVAALDKRGESVLPLRNMAGSDKNGFQQLSYRLKKEDADGAMSAAQKLGEVEELQRNPGINEGVQAEVADKLARLKSELAANADALGKMPSVKAAADEIAAHLEQVAAAEKEASGRVLLNLQVRQRPK